MSSLKNKTVLITYGPTWVAIDRMRVISNRSTGELGKRLAENLAHKGAKVTALEGPVTEPLRNKKVKVLKYHFYHELEADLNAELKKNYDIVIHAAAVSDYKPAQTFNKKLSSHLKKLTLKLIPTKKLINTIKLKSPKSFLVGFKLVDRVDTIAPKLLKNFFNQTQCDLVVANSLDKKYKAFIINQNQTILSKAQSRQELVQKLIQALT